jgi:hypothetical protein
VSVDPKCGPATLKLYEKHNFDGSPLCLRGVGTISLEQLGSGGKRFQIWSYKSDIPAVLRIDSRAVDLGGWELQIPAGSANPVLDSRAEFADPTLLSTCPAQLDCCGNLVVSCDDPPPCPVVCQPGS